MDAPAWFVYLFDFLLLGFIILAFIFVWSWRNVKNTEGKMIAEIWEPSGYPVRHIVTPDKSGETIEVDGVVYRLPKEHEDEGEFITDEDGNLVIDEESKKPKRRYPSRRYVQYPSNAPLGIKTLQVTLRIESWEKNNPEPIRPYYGRLTVTGMEWAAQKKQITATALAMDIQELEAREKEMRRMLLGVPNKMVVYLLCGGALGTGVISLIYLFQIAGVVGG